MATIRELITKWVVDVDDTALQALNDKITDSLSKTAEANMGLLRFADGAKRAGQSLTVGLTLPLTAAAGFMVKAASDAEETRNKFKQVFISIGEEAEGVADSFAKNFGLAGSTARELLGNTGDLLTGFEFTEDVALDLSRQVNELAVDLASFTNFAGGAEGASAALTKALLGETEAAKALGIVMRQDDVQAILQAKGQDKLTGSALLQAKALAALEIATRQTKKAQGDYARTSQDLAAQFRQFREDLKALAEEFGENLLPIANKALGVFRKLLQFFTNLPEPVQNAMIVVGALAAALGPLLLIMGSVAQAVVAINGVLAIFGVTAGGVIGIAPLLGSAFTIMTGPIGITIAVVAALIAGFVLLMKKSVRFRNTMADIANFLINTVLAPLRAISAIFGLDFKVPQFSRSPVPTQQEAGQAAASDIRRRAAIGRGDQTNNLSMGRVEVNVQGSTDMGPDEIRKATEAGATDAGQRLLRELGLSTDMRAQGA